MTEDERLIGEVCRCGKPAVRFLKVSGKPYCSKKKNGCPLTQKEYNEKRFKNSVRGKMYEELEKGNIKCFVCGEPAKFVIYIKKYEYCCAESMKKCPGWKKMSHERKLKWYIDHPEMREWHRNNCKEINNRPEVIEAKSSAMIRLHNTDKKFRKRYLKGYKNRAMDKIKSYENRLRQSLMMKEKYRDPEFRAKYHMGLTKEFNNLEEIFYTFLNSLYPSLFRYNFSGDNNIKWPGHYFPDFICEKWRICIDIDGHMHSMKDKNGLESDNLRTVRYMQAGWYHLSVNYKEMKYQNELAKKIINFISGITGRRVKPTYYPE